jgi:hypothetical protein
VDKKSLSLWEENMTTKTNTGLRIAQELSEILDRSHGGVWSWGIGFFHRVASIRERVRAGHDRRADRFRRG